MKNKRNRDIDLDFYRGMVMIYIVAIIHMVYWALPYEKSWIESLLLVEMPIIFFISGASFHLSFKENRSYSQFFFSRLKRVLFPYWIYLLVATLFTICLKLIGLFNFDVSQITMSNIIMMLLCPEEGYLPVFKHIWFIVPFLVISLLAPFLYKLCQKTHNSKFLMLGTFAVFIILFDVTGWLNFVDVFLEKQVRYFLVYGFFFISGFLYKSLKIKMIAFIGIVSVLTFTIIIALNGVYDLQQQKFPPTFIFMLYGIMSLCLTSVLLSYIKFKPNKIVDRYNKAGYTIYLYQNLTMLFMIGVINRTWDIYDNIFYRMILIILTFFVLVYMNYVASYLFVPIEKFVMGIFKYNKNKVKSNCNIANAE